MPNGLDRSRPMKKPLAFNARRTGSGFAHTGIGSRTPRANSRWNSQPSVAKGRFSPDFSRVTAHVPSSARERNKNARVALCPPAEYTGLKLLMILDRNISKRQEVWACFATSRCYSLSIERDYAKWTCSCIGDKRVRRPRHSENHGRRSSNGALWLRSAARSLLCLVQSRPARLSP